MQQYSTLNPNIPRANISGASGFWDSLSDSLGFGGPADDALVGSNVVADRQDTELVSQGNIVQDAAQSDDLGTYMGNLFGNVIGGVAQYGLNRLTGTQYQTNSDGTITQVAAPLPQPTSGSGSGMGAGIGIGAIVIIGAIAYFALGKK